MSTSPSPSSLPQLQAALSNEQLGYWQQRVLESERLHVRAGGSKTALSAGATLDLSELDGVVEYQPDEYTFSALAGTPLRDIEAMLAANGQYLPFDPPLVEAGATLGGTVAAGLSGPGRLRYGGVRDFFLGVRFIDGSGQLAYGGGKVVKNAAGFDLPKLMVGALGQFGLMLELTFKVFPRYQAACTLVLQPASPQEALRLMQSLAASQLEAASLDYLAPHELYVRLVGLAEALPARLERLQAFLRSHAGLAAQSLAQSRVLADEEEQALWRELREFRWLPSEHGLLKAAVTPRQFLALEDVLAERDLPRHYSVAANVAWFAWPDGQEAALQQVLQDLGLPALAVLGTWTKPLLGVSLEQAFASRLRHVLDPQQKFSLSPR